MRVKLIVSYDGTEYCGWQRQKKGNSIQQFLEKYLLKLTGENILITASGRTDAGVHAEGQVCHFDITDNKIPPHNFAYCLNNILPSDIKVLKSELASDNFHARHQAVKKTYVYRIYHSQTPQPLKDRYACFTKDKVDLAKVKQAAKSFIGEFDFKAFKKTGSTVKSTVREIFDLTINGNDDNFEIEITGSGFLYNMVRIISGTLLFIGIDKLPTSSVSFALSLFDKKYIGPTLPACGLSLKEVIY